MMELLRVSRNAWGQEVLLGVSWDLLWVFFGAAVALIVIHMLYASFWAPRVAARTGNSSRGGER